MCRGEQGFQPNTPSSLGVGAPIEIWLFPAEEGQHGVGEMGVNGLVQKNRGRASGWPLLGKLHKSIPGESGGGKLLGERAEWRCALVALAEFFRQLLERFR